jgi:hypothetical protein
LKGFIDLFQKSKMRLTTIAPATSSDRVLW